ncbi:MAG: chemotaxis protein CheD [Anaerolineaceae bacterium]|nr:chemotaxis protein CheD [Anaerolineaceae bacterium]
MPNSIAVGLAEIKISSDPDDVIVAFGLGSCLGIGMYDPKIKLAAMLHAVLPKNTGKQANQEAKYVDTGIQHLLEIMLKAGAQKSRIILKMAGGANMLSVKGSASHFDIGTRNIDSAYEVFEKMKINLINKEVGGQIGRTVRLYIQDGKMTIRKMGGKEQAF